MGAPNGSSAKWIVPLVISSFALACSIFTLWWNSLRGPDFVCGAINSVALCQLDGKKPVALMSIPLTLTNAGAQPGVIEGFDALVNTEDEKQPAQKFWGAFEGEEIPSPESIESQVLCPLAVAVGSSVHRRIWFVARDSDYRFMPGRFVVRVYGESAATETPIFLGERILWLKKPIPANKKVYGAAARWKPEITLDPEP